MLIADEWRPRHVFEYGTIYNFFKKVKWFVNPKILNCREGFRLTVSNRESLEKGVLFDKYMMNY